MTAKQSNYRYQTRQIDGQRKDRFKIDAHSRKRIAQNKNYSYLNHAGSNPDQTDSQKQNIEAYNTSHNMSINLSNLGAKGNCPQFTKNDYEHNMEQETVTAVDSL